MSEAKHFAGLPESQQPTGGQIQEQGDQFETHALSGQRQSLYSYPTDLVITELSRIADHLASIDEHLSELVKNDER